MEQRVRVISAAETKAGHEPASSDAPAHVTPAQQPEGEATAIDAPLLETLRDIEGKRCVHPLGQQWPPAHPRTN